jgi:hypothetical protein
MIGWNNLGACSLVDKLTWRRKLINVDFLIGRKDWITVT